MIKYFCAKYKVNGTYKEYSIDFTLNKDSLEFNNLYADRIDVYNSKTQCKDIKNTCILVNKNKNCDIFMPLFSLSLQLFMNYVCTDASIWDAAPQLEKFTQFYGYEKIYDKSSIYIEFCFADFPNISIKIEINPYQNKLEIDIVNDKVANYSEFLDCCQKGHLITSFHQIIFALKESCDLFFSYNEDFSERYNHYGFIDTIKRLNKEFKLKDDLSDENISRLYNAITDKSFVDLSFLIPEEKIIECCFTDGIDFIKRLNIIYLGNYLDKYSYHLKKKIFDGFKNIIKENNKLQIIGDTNDITFFDYHYFNFLPAELAVFHDKIEFVDKMNIPSNMLICLESVMMEMFDS